MAEEFCAVSKEYEEWFEKRVLPRMKQFMAHAIDCPYCQRFLLGMKDKMGMALLTASDEEYIEMMKEAFKEVEDGS